MTGPSTGFGGEGMDTLRVERCRLAGRQIMGEHNDWLAQIAQLFAALAEQMTQDAFLNVEQVSNAISEVAALNALQRLGIAAYNTADGILDGKVIAADQRFDLLHQRWIGEHKGVGSEDGTVLRAKLGGDCFLVGTRLGSSLGKGLA